MGVGGIRLSTTYLSEKEASVLGKWTYKRLSEMIYKYEKHTSAFLRVIMTKCITRISKLFFFNQI